MTAAYHPTIIKEGIVSIQSAILSIWNKGLCHFKSYLCTETFLMVLQQHRISELFWRCKAITYLIKTKRGLTILTIKVIKIKKSLVKSLINISKHISSKKEMEQIQELMFSINQNLRSVCYSQIQLLAIFAASHPWLKGNLHPQIKVRKAIEMNFRHLCKRLIKPCPMQALSSNTH